jgi:hypothetical protein
MLTLPMLVPGSAGYTGSENGFQSDKSFKTGHTFSNNGETWIEVLSRTHLWCLQWR